MMRLVRVCAALVALLFAMWGLAGCNFPGPATQTGSTGDSGAGGASEAGSEDLTRATPAQAATNTRAAPTATPTPLASPPDGWMEYQSSDTGLSLYFPPGWEVVPYTDHKLDLRETGGDGWVEINIIDASNDEDFSLEYAPGIDAQTLLDGILSAAREDGDFGEVGRMETRVGLTAWVGEGTHELLSERELIGIIVLPDRAVLVIGHAPVRGDTWDSALIEAYRRILWTIQPDEI